MLNKNSEIIHYIGKCIRRLSDREFRNYVLTYEEDPFRIRIVSPGDKNRDRNIFIIKNFHPSYGFFAEYRHLLDALYFADRFGFTPVVNYRKNYAYAEEEKVHGTDNPYEYYFKQPGDVTVEEALDSHNVIFSADECVRPAEALNSKERFRYELSGEYVKNMARIAGRYVRLNENTKAFLAETMPQIFKDGKSGVLGIHYRGSDYKQAYNNHPVAVQEEQMAEKIREAMDRHGFDTIFLATDDKGAIRYFEKYFSGRICFYEDVYRSGSQVSVAFQDDERRFHHYRLGLEVLRDMMTLANCDGLIAGVSQVSNAAIITRESLGKKYEYLEIINNGINHSNNHFTVNKR